MLPMTRAPNVRLAVENLPENVSLVREVLAGLAGAVPLADGQLDDIKTVVSEACNNVVIHAYDGARGPLDVEIRVTDGTLEIAVRDMGGGLRPRSPSDDRAEGIGIPVIRALSDRVEFADGPGHGTEVRMQFDVPGARDLGPPTGADVPVPNGARSHPGPPDADPSPDDDPPAARSHPDHRDAVPEADDRLGQDQRGEDQRGKDRPGKDRPGQDRPGQDRLGVTLVVAPLSLAGNVLSRPLTALAARARFSIDRLSDVQLVTDAIAAHAGRSLSGDRLRVAIALDTRDLELRVGPLRPGTAGQLIDDTAVGGLEPLIATLADEVSVDHVDGADFLTLRMFDAR
jgi:serine/threonine-protein kinase RsbW